MVNKYRFTMTTILETENLNLIQDDINQMSFFKSFDAQENIGKDEFLIEETEENLRHAKTFVKIEAI